MHTLSAVAWESTLDLLLLLDGLLVVSEGDGATGSEGHRAHMASPLSVQWERSKQVLVVVVYPLLSSSSSSSHSRSSSSMPDPLLHYSSSSSSCYFYYPCCLRLLQCTEVGLVLSTVLGVALNVAGERYGWAWAR